MYVARSCLRKMASRSPVKISLFREAIRTWARAPCTLWWRTCRTMASKGFHYFAPLHQGRWRSQHCDPHLHRGKDELHASHTCQLAFGGAGAGRIQGHGPDRAVGVLAQHADIRQMLDEIDAMALGGRAIAHLAFVTVGKGDNPDLVEFLTPVAKVYCTDAGMRGADLGIQVLGGYGNLREYRLEQTYRDARITPIYEGANGIHAKILATRLANGPSGAAIEAFVTDKNIQWWAVRISEKQEIWREMREQLARADDAPTMAHGFMQTTIDTLLACHWEWKKHPPRAVAHQTSVQIRNELMHLRPQRQG